VSGTFSAAGAAKCTACMGVIYIVQYNVAEYELRMSYLCINSI